MNELVNHWVKAILPHIWRVVLWFAILLIAVVSTVLMAGCIFIDPIFYFVKRTTPCGRNLDTLAALLDLEN